MVSVSDWLTVAFTFIHWGGALDSSHLHLQALEEVTVTFKWEINRFASHFLYNLYIYSPKPDFGSPPPQKRRLTAGRKPMWLIMCIKEEAGKASIAC